MSRAPTQFRYQYPKGCCTGSLFVSIMTSSSRGIGFPILQRTLVSIKGCRCSRHFHHSVSIITNSGTTLCAQCLEQKSVHLFISCCPLLLYNRSTLSLQQKNTGEQFHCLLDYELLVTIFFTSSTFLNKLQLLLTNFANS